MLFYEEFTNSLPIQLYVYCYYMATMLHSNTRQPAKSCKANRQVDTLCLISSIRSAHIDGTPSNKEENQTQQSYLLGLAHSNSHGRHYRSVASHLHRR